MLLGSARLALVSVNVMTSLSSAVRSSSVMATVMAVVAAAAAA